VPRLDRRRLPCFERAPLAELDAGNALPWAFLADEAVAAGDVSGRAEAWFHMAGAKHVDDRMYSPLQPILASADGGPGDLMAAKALSAMAVGIAAGAPWPVEPSAGCRPAALADVNQAQLCKAFAEVLFEHSDTLLSRSLGATLLQRIEHDVARGSAVNAELAAMDDALQPAAGEPACDGIRQQLAFISRVAAVGPQVALRERAGASAAR